jgi:gamma-glutamyltranspeptidase/glutathione hydrolase
MKHRRTFAGPRNWCVVPLTLLLICAPADAADGSHAGFKGLVVSVSAPASDVGYRILQRGGTAVDGAVATAFALAVTWPAAGNIGGGGFMMVYPGAGEQPVCVEYRETAPTGATPTMFAADSRKDGPKVSGVPGTVAGLALAHGKYGKLPWADVVIGAGWFPR